MGARGVGGEGCIHGAPWGLGIERPEGRGCAIGGAVTAVSKSTAWAENARATAGAAPWGQLCRARDLLRERSAAKGAEVCAPAAAAAALPAACRIKKGRGPEQQAVAAAKRRRLWLGDLAFQQISY